MGTTVKTYKALREQQVDGRTRYFGDYIPEAETWDWKIQSVYLRSGHMEVAYIDSDVLSEALELQRANDGVQEEELAEAATEIAPVGVEDSEETPEETEEEPEPEVEVEETAEEVTPTKKLKVRKK